MKFMTTINASTVPVSSMRRNFAGRSWPVIPRNLVFPACRAATNVSIAPPAAKIFSIAPEAVTASQRRGAKTINFGVLYGMGPFALAAQLGVPRAEAKAFITAYFDRFPRIRACLDAILEKARATGGTETIFGRVRPIPGLHDRNHNVRANAERMAMNAPFQGSAADLIKKAMVALDARLEREIPTARMLLQVHDELVLECDAGDAPRVASLAKETMEGVVSLAVPLTVETAVGADWAAAK